MAKFLVKATYTPLGIAGLGKEGGTARAEVVQALIENAGGQVEVLYYAFGEYDLYLVAELPNTVTAAALGIAVRSAGGVEARVVPLITAEEIDAAAQFPVMYQPPGH